MTFLLDNLTAVIVGTVLLGALLMVQHRGQQDAIEAVHRHRGQVMAGQLADVLEREVENARGRDETERVFTTDFGGTPLSPDEYRFRILRGTAADGTEFTRHLAFPTLVDPDALGSSDLWIVSYVVEETGETVFVDGRDRPLLRARRFVFPRGGPIRAAGVYERLVDFDVTAFEPDGTVVRSRLELAETPLRVHIEVVYAPEHVAELSGDQAAGQAYSTRHARTVRIPAATAYEEGLEVPPGGGGIPPLPGDDDYEPPSDPPPSDPPPSDPPPSDPPPSDPPPSDPPPSDPDADLDDRDEIIVCHDGKDKKIKFKDLDKHLEHGDTRGSCAGPDGTGEDDLVLICHKPEAGGGDTQVIKRKDIEKHEEHGDHLGRCR